MEQLGLTGIVEMRQGGVNRPLLFFHIDPMGFGRDYSLLLQSMHERVNLGFSDPRFFR